MEAAKKRAHSPAILMACLSKMNAPVQKYSKKMTFWRVRLKALESMRDKWLNFFCKFDCDCAVLMEILASQHCVPVFLSCCGVTKVVKEPCAHAHNKTVIPLDTFITDPIFQQLIEAAEVSGWLVSFLHLHVAWAGSVIPGLDMLLQCQIDVDNNITR